MGVCRRDGVDELPVARTAPRLLVGSPLSREYHARRRIARRDSSARGEERDFRRSGRVSRMCPGDGVDENPHYTKRSGDRVRSLGTETGLRGLPSRGEMPPRCILRRGRLPESEVIHRSEVRC